MSDDRGSSGDDPLRRFLHAESGPLAFLREMLSSVLTVALVGALLFAVAGVWPPMVAIESGSMAPHMHKGDLVFITEPDRFSPEYAYGDTGVVPYHTAVEHGYTSFGSYGSVIVYEQPNHSGPPIIHRARFHVQAGENWYDRANQSYLHPGTNSCAELRFCPAPHAGFITKGDNNAEYDQVSLGVPPVRAGWIRGIARVRIPLLGWIRLLFSGAAGALSTPSLPVEPAVVIAGSAFVSTGR